MAMRRGAMLRELKGKPCKRAGALRQSIKVGALAIHPRRKTKPAGCENQAFRIRDRRKFGGATVREVLSRLLSDQGWTRGLDCEAGASRG
jgi:hypothetical protein